MLALDVPTAPDGVVEASGDSSPHQDVEPAEPMIDEPPPLGEADVMSTRRMIGFVALAALLVVPATLITLLLVIGLIDAAFR